MAFVILITQFFSAYQTAKRIVSNTLTPLFTKNQESQILVTLEQQLETIENERMNHFQHEFSTQEKVSIEHINIALTILHRSLQQLNLLMRYNQF
mgnify:CR=1 FL=1